MVDKAQKTKILMENFNKYLNEDISDNDLTKYYNLILTELNKITNAKVVYKKDLPTGRLYIDDSTGLSYIIDLKITESNLEEYVVDMINNDDWRNSSYDNEYDASQVSRHGAYLSTIPYTKFSLKIQVMKNGRNDYLHTSKQNKVDKLPASLEHMFHQEYNKQALPIISKIQKAYEDLSPKQFMKYIDTMGNTPYKPA